MKVYIDPNPEIVLSFKGSTTMTPPEGFVFGPGADWKHRQCRACGGVMNPAECPDGRRGCIVWHGWCCSQCGGNRVNDEAFEATMSEEDFKPSPGFFYCPYMPLKFPTHIEDWENEGGQ